VELGPGTLRNWLKRGAVLIDLRDTEAFGAGPIAKPIPLNCAELALTSEQLVPDLAAPIAYRCARGNRRALAADEWQQLG
jgi:rhodanese-related sulfurtransferase